MRFLIVILAIIMIVFCFHFSKYHMEEACRNNNMTLAHPYVGANLCVDKHGNVYFIQDIVDMQKMNFSSEGE